MKVDNRLLAGGGVAVLVLLAGLAYWIWGGSSTDATQVVSAECKAKETFEVTAADYTLGKADAPVTIIEYASMTCPHCARFTRDVYPLLKSNYVDKGYVRYVFREFPLDRVALVASVVGRCLPHDAYLPYVELMYGEIETWATQQDPRAAIKEMARRAGMSGDEFEKCMLKEDDAKKIVAASTVATKDYCIGGTPTFLMNGKKLAGGEIAWSELDTKLREELKAKGVTVPAAAATEAPAATDGAAPADGTATPPAETAPAPTEAPASGTTPAPVVPAATPAPAASGAAPPATTTPAASAPSAPAKGGTPH